MKYLLTIHLILSFFACEARSHTIKSIGDIGQVAVPLAAFATTVALHDCEGSKQFAKAFAATEFTTYALKYSINERRPKGGTHSFPSGHTAVAFSGASFMHRRYGTVAGLIAYGVAGFVGYSRVQAKEHWVHDVVAGALIGMTFSYFFGTPYLEKWHLCPLTTASSVGISCERSF